MTDITNTFLGKPTQYIDQYDPSLLMAIGRQSKRDELNISQPLPFHGEDIWTAYEISWLDPSGKPMVAMAEISIPCTSKNLIESKSLKLYLNSFNQSTFHSKDEVTDLLTKDISQAIEAQATITMMELDNPPLLLSHPEGICLDNLTISCDTYTTAPRYLETDSSVIINETLYSNCLKSNCLVTGQPDWATITIHYAGPAIDHVGLLRYIVSYRNHMEFHEQCVERIFMDILTHCHPERLLVFARYTRRGGLDINPYRSTHAITINHQRLVRQ